jgi:hypothetical protein
MTDLERLCRKYGEITHRQNGKEYILKWDDEKGKMIDSRKENKLMKVEVKEIYKCDHCNKLYQVKGAAERHERACHRNPDNERACFGCDNLEKKETSIGMMTPYGEINKPVNCLYCKIKYVFLYPPKVEHKGNAFDLGEFNEPMPKVCESYSRQEFFI